MQTPSSSSSMRPFINAMKKQTQKWLNFLGSGSFLFHAHLLLCITIRLYFLGIDSRLHCCSQPYLTPLLLKKFNFAICFCFQQTLIFCSSSIWKIVSFAAAPEMKTFYVNSAEQGNCTPPFRVT